jgi:hypothetical protein
MSGAAYRLLVVKPATDHFKYLVVHGGIILKSML